MDKIDELLTRGVAQIIPSKDDLENLLRSKKKIRLYTGIDPTSPEIHIGHTVWMWKLRAFQELGHEVIVLIGDFTGTVGDPSGKSEARKTLELEQVRDNAKTYIQQIGKIIRFNGPNPAKVRYNSEWLAKLSIVEIAQIMSKLTVAQVIERDMFQKRLQAGKDLFLNEFLYPVMQGYDSVILDVDLEVGGTDQLFNMMTGRDLMKKLKNQQKLVMTLKLLTDGAGNKIGKTEGNAIAIAGNPDTLFGQIMSLPDSSILPIYELATNIPMSEINSIRSILGENKDVMSLKKELSWQIVSQFNTPGVADQARKSFESTFQKKEEPLEIQPIKVTSPDIIDALVQSRLAPSKSQARRLVEQGAVEVNGVKITNSKAQIVNGNSVRVGKTKFARFIISN